MVGFNYKQNEQNPPVESRYGNNNLILQSTANIFHNPKLKESGPIIYRLHYPIPDCHIVDALGTLQFCTPYVLKVVLTFLTMHLTTCYV